MKKIVFLLSLLLLIMFSATISFSQVQKKNLQTEVNALASESPVAFFQTDNKIPLNGPTDAVLYTQLSPWTGGLNTAQDFTDFGADANVADDFVVPTGQTWDINAIKWVAGYYNGTGPADGFNVEFYNDAAGSPNPTAITSFYLTSYTAVNNEFTAELTSTVSLTEGTYWVSIQGVMGFGAGGQYGFGDVDNTVAINNPMHRMDIDGYWAWEPIGTWLPVTDTNFNNVEDFDMCFELLDELPQDPLLLVDPGSTFDFGNVALNNTVSQVFTLLNVGGGVLTISNISLADPLNGVFALTNVSTLPGNLPPDAISFEVEFSPITAGDFTETINITDNLTDVITPVVVNGRGVIPPPNDDCATAQFVTGPYPVLATPGSLSDATISCPGVLDWQAVWYEIDLPYESNFIELDFCLDDAGATVGSYGIILTSDCSCSSPSFIFSTGEYFSSANCVNDLNYLVSGPGTVYFPLYSSTGGDFTFDVNVSEYFRVSGTLSYANTAMDPMLTSTVTLDDGSKAVVASSATDNFGYYQFDFIPPGSYTLGGATVQARGGTNILDAINSRQFLGGGYSMDALQQTSADVNSNAGVDILDAIFMQQSLSGPLPAGWTAPDFVFENPPAVVTTSNLSIDFRTLCSGDPNGTFEPVTPTPPVNDDFCNPTSLVVNAAPITDDNTFASTEAWEVAGTCWFAAPTNSIWYSFVAPASGDVQITTDFVTPLDDTQLTLHDWTGGDCLNPTLVELGCGEDDGVTGPGYMAIIDATGLTSGATYYIRMEGYDTSSGEFQIEVVEPPAK